MLLCDPYIHDSYGLRFMITHSRDSLKIMPEVLEALMRALAQISLTQPRTAKEVPIIEEGTEVDQVQID